MIKQGYFLTQGFGVAEHSLTAFDRSLIDAKVGEYNHIKVSSVLPSGLEKFDGVKIQKGSVVYSAYSNLISKESGRTLSTCVAVGLPKDKGNIGMIMEHSDFAELVEVENVTIKLVKDAMSKRGIAISEIISAPISAVVPTNSFLSVFSALVMW